MCANQSVSQLKLKNTGAAESRQERVRRSERTNQEDGAVIATSRIGIELYDALCQTRV